MTTAERTRKLVLPHSPARVGTAQVVRELVSLCDSLQPGDFIPTQAELMRQLGASERSVRLALEELKRQGKVVTRRGSGTSIADVAANATLADDSGTIHHETTHHSPPVWGTIVDAQTVIAIAKPDQGGFFDRAMSHLHSHTEGEDLSLISRFIDPEKTALSALMDKAQYPLGYILFRNDLYPLAKQLQDAGQRVVLVGTPPVDMTFDVPNVYNNHEQGGYVSAKHLLDLGHRRIAFRAAHDAQQSLRWRGIERAVADHRRKGIRVEVSLLHDGETDAWRTDNSSARAYFARPDAPTGIIVWNDYEAIVLLTFLSYLGIRVPDQVSLVGYDNQPEGAKVHPALTTIDSAMDLQLQTALSLLVSSTPLSQHRSYVILPNLIQRESCAPLTS